MFTRCCGVLVARFLSSLAGLFRFVRLNPAMNGWAIFRKPRAERYRRFPLKPNMTVDARC